MRKEVTSVDRSPLFRLSGDGKGNPETYMTASLGRDENIEFFFFLAGICQGQFTSGFSALNTGPFCLRRQLDWFFLQAGAQRAFIVA